MSVTTTRTRTHNNIVLFFFFPFFFLFFIFSFSVAQTKQERLTTVAGAVSDPQNPSYGHFLTKSEVDALTAPAVSDMLAVTDWLGRFPLSKKIKVGHHTIEVHCNVSVCEQMLKTRFRKYARQVTPQNPTPTAGTSSRTSTSSSLVAVSYTLPPAVARVVAALYGLQDLPTPPGPGPQIRTNLHLRGPLDQPVVNVTPAVLYQSYHLSGVTPSASNKNRQAVVEFHDQHMSPQHLAKFFETFLPEEASSNTSQVYEYVGSPNEHPYGFEADLDIQYIMGTAPGVKTEFWMQGQEGFCTDIKGWTTALLSANDIPLVHSM